jgi:two-component system sensor histidine kinase YesM
MRIPKIFKSLQFRIFFIIFILLFVPVLLLLNYNFTRTEVVLKNNTSELVLSNLEQIGQKIDNVSEDIMKISSMVSSNSVIASNLMGYGHKEIDKFRLRELEYLGADDVIKISEVQKQIYYVKNHFFNYTTHVILFGADGNLYCSLDTVYDELKFKTEYIKKYKEQIWYNTLKSNESLGLWTAPFTYDIEGDNKRYISLSRVFKDNITQDKLGIITVNYSEDNFKQFLGSDVNGIITLLNREKEPIFSSSQNYDDKSFEQTYSKIPDRGKGNFINEIEDKQYLVNYYSIEKNGWSLVSMIPYKDVMREIELLKTNTYSINFIIFISFFLIALSMIVHMTNPLKNLIWKIRKMKIGEHSIGLKDVDSFDDVSGLVISFEYMMKRVEELVNVVIQEQKRESDLKYEALRAQINPHFLFNTLNTIKWSALMSGSENVSKMISALGKLLEVSMNKGDDEIPLNEEIDLTEAYVYIQNIRFNDKIKLIYNIDEYLGKLKVLKLILQPIVENAIIHGFKDKTTCGEINIVAELRINKLVLVVKDNGSGISKDKIQRIFETNDDLQKQKYSSIGLWNINERLKIKYGNEYSLTIESEEGKGTTVFVLLPIIENNDGG